MIFPLDGIWRMPNLMEKVYYNHIIGKAELKSKIGWLGGQVYGTPLEIVRVDVFETVNLNHDAISKPLDDVLILRPHAYNVPLDKDKFMCDLFKYSLTHNIVEVNPNNAKLYLAESKDGKTNITQDVMKLLAGRLALFGNPPR